MEKMNTLPNPLELAEWYISGQLFGDPATLLRDLIEHHKASIKNLENKYQLDHDILLDRISNLEWELAKAEADRNWDLT